MSTLSQTGCDDAALFSFPPDGSRATFLYARMIERLAQSVDEIINGCSSHFEFEESIVRLPQRFHALTRVAPEVYCIYFDLLRAVRRDDLDACSRLLSEMDTHLNAPLASFYRRWGALPESTARRYITYVNVDPTTKVSFEALSSSKFNRVRRLADDAFGVLRALLLKSQQRFARCSPKSFSFRAGLNRCALMEQPRSFAGVHYFLTRTR